MAISSLPEPTDRSHLQEWTFHFNDAFGKIPEGSSRTLGLRSARAPRCLFDRRRRARYDERWRRQRWFVGFDGWLERRRQSGYRERHGRPKRNVEQRQRRDRWLFGGNR